MNQPARRVEGDGERGLWTPGTKFAVLALDNCATVAFNEPIALTDGVTAFPRCPLVLPEHWRNWLGTLTVEHLENANFVFVLQRPSETPDILDVETLEMERILTAYWFGLLLQGIPDYRDSLIAFGGVSNGGEISVRNVAKINTAHRHRFGARPRINAQLLASAGTTASSLIAVHGGLEFRRVRLGFKACLRGIEEPLPEERLHQFVRAVDGLMHLPRQRGEEEFVRRGPTFANGDRLPLVLSQLYRLRNAQEHLNDLRTALDLDEQDLLVPLGSLRAYQAEQLALSAYRRLLTTGGLLAHFRDDTSVDALWALPPDQRRTLWGAPFDLDGAEREHNQMMATIGIDD